MIRYLWQVTDVSYPRLVGAISLAHGANEFISITIPPIIPLLITDLDISYSEAGLLLTVFFMMYSLFQIPAGVLGDRMGKKRLLVVGLVITAVGIIMASLANDYLFLVIAQTVAGIGGSTFHPTGMAIISDIETEATEGKAMGIFGFGRAMGTMVSPLIIGGLASVSGWNVALGGAAVVFTASALAFVGLFSYEDDQGIDDEFRWRESVTQVDRRSIYRALSVMYRPRILILLLITFFVSIQTRAIQTFTTAFIIDETGLSFLVSNFSFFVLLFGASLSSLVAGDLADRFHRESIGVSASVVTGLFVGLTLFVPKLGGELPPVLFRGVLVTLFFIIGVLMYAAIPVNNALVSEHANKMSSGSLFGAMQTAAAIGSAFGPALFGQLASRWGIEMAFPVIGLISVSIAILFAFHNTV